MHESRDWALWEVELQEPDPFRKVIPERDREEKFRQTYEEGTNGIQ